MTSGYSAMASCFQLTPASYPATKNRRSDHLFSQCISTGTIRGTKHRGRQPVGIFSKQGARPPSQKMSHKKGGGKLHRYESRKGCEATKKEFQSLDNYGPGRSQPQRSAGPSREYCMNEASITTQDLDHRIF